MKSIDQAAAEYKIPPKYAGYSMTIIGRFGGVKGNIQGNWLARPDCDALDGPQNAGGV
jgi:hypothetical protein